MAHSYTTHYNLIKPEYQSRQTAEPPAPGDNPYLSGLWAAMDLIDAQLQIAADHRTAINAVSGIIRGDGAGGFVPVLAVPPLFETAAQSGRYYPLCAPYAADITTLAGVANRIQLSPIIWPFSLTGSPVTVNLTIGVSTLAAGNAKILVYGNNSSDEPGSLLAASANISTGSVGFKTASMSLTGVTSLPAGTKLWVGVWTSAAPTLRAIPLSSAWAYGGIGASGASLGTVVRRTLAFGTAPDPWTYSAAEVTVGITPYAVFYSI